MRPPEAEQEQPRRPPGLPEKIRPELNIEKWSIWQPTNSRAAPKARKLEREFTLPDGRKVVAKVEMVPTTRGNLTTEDQRVYYALVRFWEERGRSTSFTPFSLQRLAKILRRKWGKKTREALVESLMRLRGTLFIWEKAYVDGPGGATLGLLDTFNILSDLKIARRGDDAHRTTEAGYFRFHESILKNLLAHHTKPVRLDVVLSFESEIAQILYTHLDLILSDKSSYERRTKELFKDLGFEGKDDHKPSVRVRKLGAALEELQGVELTTGRITKVTLEKTKDGADSKLMVRKGRVTKVAVVEAGGGRAEVIALPVATQNKQEAQAEELVRHFHRVVHGTAEAVPTGKAIDQAASLIARLGWEKARHVIDFAHREAPKTRYKIVTFGGIIQYTTPALQDFEKTQGERERQRKAQAVVEAQRRRDADERAGDEARRAEARRRWEGLSPEEQARVEREAFEKSNGWFLDQHGRCNRAGQKEEAEKWRWRIIEAHLIESPA
jgi:hypothetical protein